jgi:hypothetical protein
MGKEANDTLYVKQIFEPKSPHIFRWLAFTNLANSGQELLSKKDSLMTK